jgi:hypothetical protein
MGSYSKLRIREIEFETWKNEVDNSIMILFTEREKRIRQVPLPQEYDHLLEENEASPLFTVEYVSDVETIKGRLDFLGFTLETSSQVFELEKNREIEECQKSVERMQRYPAPNNHDPSSLEAYTNRQIKRADLLENSTAETWLLALREAFLASPDADSSQLSELANSFRPVGKIPYSRFPMSVDDRFRLRFELEAFQSGEVVYDVSELVDAGECLTSDPLTDWARESVHARDREALHLIVLTEGASDKFVLERALKILRPELAEFISFMDFAGLKVEGGASFLASLIRSFAAAGIRDRIVAIFDNDTAGCLSQYLVSKHELPENIRVLRYPDIEFAKAYPTLGPAGLTIMDVNGSAAGIELYLGADVLQEPTGSCLPIQWKGFEATMKRYQGEVLDKKACLKRVSEKFSRFERDGGNTSDSTWMDLRAIIETICSAFGSADADFLLSYIRQEAENE